MPRRQAIHQADHPLRRTAKEFAANLRRALSRSGLDRADLAKRSGLTVSGIECWIVGRTMPTFASAAALATALDAPHLAEIVREARTRPCENGACGAPVLTEKMGAPRIYCSDVCRKLVFERDRGDTKQRASNARRIADAAQAAVSLHRVAVAAFCRGCQPEGLCRDARCALRIVSPLPLIGGIA